MTALHEEVARLRDEAEQLRAILHRQLRMPLDEGAVTIRATDELLARYECDHVLDDGRCLCCGHDVEYSP